MTRRTSCSRTTPRGARRLEVIRDSILAVSGRLDPKLFGPSVQPYREKADIETRLFAGPLDGDGRRSIFTSSFNSWKRRVS